MPKKKGNEEIRIYKDEDLNPIIKNLVDKGYDENVSFLGKGNWGEVYKVRHLGLNCDRAVKILLPKYLNNKNVKSRFVEEAQKMTSLSHNHIVNIFDLGNPEGIPYYVMEFVESKDFKTFLDTNTNLENRDFMEMLYQICDVLLFIHQNNIVHLDVKSENILVDPNLKGKGIKLADFGLAHYLVGPSDPRYRVTADIAWMPPSLAEYRGKEIPRSAFKPSQDLAYLGKMLEVLNFEKYIKNVFSIRQRILLSKIIEDLCEEKINNDEQLKEKIQKLSATHPPTGGIPELAASLAIDSYSTIRIPKRDIVPTTNRVRSIIEQPEFQRLRRVKQLGPTSLIYPGAQHTRFEHSLGAYSLSVRYLNHLLSDPQFDYCFNQEDLTTLLVAVLLHDIGHYPFAHQLEELHLPSLPDHKKITCDILEKKPPIINVNDKKESKLVSVIEKEFKVDCQKVIKIISPTYFGDTSQSKKEKILGSFLDGALDVDKQDYLVRDSHHVGLDYASHMDRERLLRALTISRYNHELAITEKGKTAVEFLIMSRSAMFSEVYWHHTNRAATSMIQKAFVETIKHRKISRDEILSILFSSSDNEILEFLRENGPDYIAELLPNPTKWNVRRQVYKRFLTFASQYEVPKSIIYEKLIKLTPEKRTDLEKEIVKYLNNIDKNLNVKLYEIIIDIPFGDEKLIPVQIVYPNTQDRLEISLKNFTHFDTSIFDQFFKFAKKARVFCHPRLKEDLKVIRSKIREFLGAYLGVVSLKSN